MVKGYSDETVSIEDVKCVRETDKAILIVLDDVEEYWIPKSQIDDDSEVYRKGDEGTLVITKWIADQKGIL